MKTKTNLIIIGILILIILCGGYYYQNRITNLKEKVQTEVNLKLALTDSLKTYKNENNELVSEKLSLVANLKELTKMNDNLTSNQKELISRLNALKKEKDIIASALVQSELKIDSLQANANVEVKDSSILFSETNQYFNYKIKVDNVIPFKEYSPSLYFEQIRVYNKQFIEFHWENNKQYGYPISFSITNSNPYFDVTDMDSYVIPNIKKEEIKPTFWKKVGNFFSDGKNKVVWAGIGAGVTYIILK